MPQSLRNRFNGQSKEVVQDARLEGTLETSRKRNCSLGALEDFLQEMSPGEKFSLCRPENAEWANPFAFMHLVEAMVTKLREIDSYYKAQLDKSESEIHELRKQLEYYKHFNWEKARPVVENFLNYCEAKQ